MLPCKVSSPAHRELPAWATRLIGELLDADTRAEALARSLTPQQLNWPPRPGAWSIGQCLEHLCKTNGVYLPPIAEALQAQETNVVQELRLGAPTRWFIRNYIAPNPNGPRAKAPKKAAPPKDVDPRILDLFLQSNEAARELIRKCANYDVNALRFKNPFVPLLRFTVGAGLEIVSKHEARHLLQAENVRQAPDFPT